MVEIADRAFSQQDSIRSLQLPEGLRRIGIYAFSDCPGLSDTLRIPTTLRSIGNGAFDDCPRLTCVVWQADSCQFEMEETYYATFNRDFGLGSIIITSNVQQLPSHLFNAAGYVHTIIIAKGLQTIGRDVFSHNSTLDSVALPTSLRTIEHGAFYETNIRHLVLPDSLKEISTYTFSYDRDLLTIDMGTEIESIGNYAFVDCSQLQRITLRTVRPPDVMDATFKGIPPTAVLAVPAEAVEQYRSHPVWGTQFRRIELLQDGATQKGTAGRTQ